MRKSKTTGNLKVHAVAGTYVVILGFHLPETNLSDFMGFAIHRTDHTDDVAGYLEGMKAFAETDPGYPAGAMYPTNDHPIQSYQWADYSAKPGHEYTYKVTALKGVPTALLPFEETIVKITTESPEGGTHDVYFNRGTAASQEYVRRFGDLKPAKVPNNKAFEWLSRGLYEALTEYVESCIPGKQSLCIAAYEFNYAPFLELLKRTIDRGVEIKIVYDARKKIPGDKNRKMVDQTGLTANCTPRTAGKSYISHNKFIVKLEKTAGSKKYKPISVWTGGTNFSIGGIFGHSNVAHVVEDPAIAETYHSYWLQLKADPTNDVIKGEVETITPDLSQPLPEGTSIIFSPRNSLDMLTYYAELAKNAKDGLFMTFAFGINKLFKDVYANSAASLRFALLEQATRPMGDKTPEDIAAKKKELNEIKRLRKLVENVFAIGNLIQTNEFDGWVQESLSNLNKNVSYVHNKFALIDPLSNDPIVIAGSANFSNASTTDNDENMLVIRGNTRVADIYLGEFMRLFKHHSFRESLTWRKPGSQPKPLRTDQWWKGYYGNTSESARRTYFAQV